MFQGANTDEEYRRKLKNRNKLTDARGHLSAGRRTRGLWIHGLVLFFDLGKAVGSRPFTVGRREDCLVGERAGAALPDGGQSLIESVVVKETKDDHCGWKFGTVIAAFGGRDVLHAREHA